MTSGPIVRKPRARPWLARRGRWIKANWGWLIALLGGLAGFLLTAYAVLKLAPDWFAETDGLDAKGRSDARHGVRTASLALLAGALAVIGAIYTARTFALNRAGQLTERFTRAIEQLGHKELDVRLGGIYALERIAEDSNRDRPQVVEVLTAYVREHARRKDVAPREHAKLVGALVPGGDWDPDTPAHPATDVQAALTVLARRKFDREREASRAMDLSYTNLRGADLRGGNFAAATFTQTDLRQTSLDGTDLTGAFFLSADLRRAYLTDAKLQKSSLVESNLSKAQLYGANLSSSKIVGTVLTDAYFDERTIWPEGVDAWAAVADSTPYLGPPDVSA